MDSFEYDGTEANLENLLMWWCTRFPAVEYECCKDEPLAICCHFDPLPCNQALTATAESTKHGDPIPINFVDLETNVEIRMVPGDILTFKDERFHLERDE